MIYCSSAVYSKMVCKGRENETKRWVLHYVGTPNCTAKEIFTVVLLVNTFVSDNTNSFTK